jgi:hypothetical protein
VLADLRACGTLARDGARLACFDGVLAAEGAFAPRAAAAARAIPDETPRGTTQTLEREERDDDRRTVTIVEINPMLSGVTTFVTATGQVYVQTSGGEPPGGYPGLPFETTVRGGALGSLFLYLSERRRVRVKMAE